MKRLVVCCLILALSIPVFCGCRGAAGAADARDRSAPLARRAQAKEREGDTDAALRLYGEALESDPNLARIHLDMALLLDSHKKDYVRAIYHYRRYLEMRPETEKTKLIEDRIRLAKQLLVAELAPGRSNEARIEDLVSKKEAEAMVAAVEKENAVLRSKVGLLEKELADTRRLLSETRELLKKSRERPNTEVSNASRSRATEVAVVRDQVNDASRASVRTYRVRRGDTLSSIALDIYDDASMSDKIFAANRDSVSDPHKLQVDQVLLMP